VLCASVGFSFLSIFGSPTGPAHLSASGSRVSRDWAASLLVFVCLVLRYCRPVPVKSSLIFAAELLFLLFIAQEHLPFSVPAVRSLPTSRMRAGIHRFQLEESAPVGGALVRVVCVSSVLGSVFPLVGFDVSAAGLRFLLNHDKALLLTPRFWLRTRVSPADWRLSRSVYACEPWRASRLMSS
jgi:hypothetical protein